MKHEMRKLHQTPELVEDNRRRFGACDQNGSNKDGQEKIVSKLVEKWAGPDREGWKMWKVQSNDSVTCKY
jgi:hypothetical protein